MPLEYRMHTKDDEAALARLWSDHTGWGEFNSETWGRRLLRSPFGDACISIAVDKNTGEIIGQSFFIPSRVLVDGHEIKALRPFAAIMSRGYRARLGFSHPMMGMYQCAAQALRNEGYQLVYALPDPRWRRVFAMLPWLQTGMFPLYSLPLPLTAPLALGDGFSASPITEYTEEIDRLWTTASRLHECVVLRDSRVMKWKTGGRDHLLGIRRGSDLVGLALSRQKGDRQWLITDLLAADADESLRATLAAACNFAHLMSGQANPDAPIHKVAVLTTPFMEPTLRALGFQRDAYDFLLMVHILDPSLPRALVHPSRWFVSASD